MSVRIYVQSYYDACRMSGAGIFPHPYYDYGSSYMPAAACSGDAAGDGDVGVRVNCPCGGYKI